MKDINKLFIIISVIIIIIFFIICKEIVPIIKEKNCKNRVFNNMQEKSDNVVRGIVWIIGEYKNSLFLWYNVKEMFLWIK